VLSRSFISRIFFAAGDVVAVLIENNGGESKIVVIATFDFAKFDRFQIYVREHGKAHQRLVFPEKLRCRSTGKSRISS